MNLSLIAIGLLSTSQPIPQEAPLIDPALPDEIRPTIEAAIEAELDDKRGPDNAMKVLEAGLQKYGKSAHHIMAIRLRTAGVFLRRRFLSDAKFPMPIRYEQALSTFSRLDLTEPGLTDWFQKTLKHHPEGKEKFGTKKSRRLPIAVLLRGSGLDPKLVNAAFVDGFKNTGFDLAIVPAKKARMLVILKTETPRQTEPGRRAVRLVMGIESIVDGETTWRHSLFRTEAADSFEAAVTSGLKWLVRIGGRDLLFRWLGETAFDTLLPNPEPADHEGHGHH